MSVDEDVLTRLMQTNDRTQKYLLHYVDKVYALENVLISKLPMPVNRPTTRGGVYSVADNEFKIKGTIHDLSLVPYVSKMMLGPNTHFEEILITTNLEVEGKYNEFTLFTYLTNVMHNSSKIEFNMLIVRTLLRQI